MNTERKERQKSIRAARDWLSGAADALAGEDDLAGDLKVMLARAELARVAASRRARLRRRVRFLLPPLAAAAIWAAVSWGSAPPAERAQADPTPPRVQTTAQGTGDVRAPAQETHAAAAVLPPQEVVAATAPETPPPIRAEEEGRSAVPADVRAAVPQPRTHEISRMPDRDMQRLMQVGGKILRE